MTALEELNKIEQDTKLLKFGEALEELKAGSLISRFKWYREAYIEALHRKKRFNPGYWQIHTVLGSRMIIARLRNPVAPKHPVYAPAQPY